MLLILAAEKGKTMGNGYVPSTRHMMGVLFLQEQSGIHIPNDNLQELHRTLSIPKSINAQVCTSKSLLIAVLVLVLEFALVWQIW